MAGGRDGALERWDWATAGSRTLEVCGWVGLGGAVCGLGIALRKGTSIPQAITRAAALAATGAAPITLISDYAKWKRRSDDAFNVMFAGAFTGYGMALWTGGGPAQCFRTAFAVGAVVGFGQIALWRLSDHLPDAKRLVVAKGWELEERRKDQDIPTIPWPRWFPVQKEMDVDYEILKIRAYVLQKEIQRERDKDPGGC